MDIVVFSIRNIILVSENGTVEPTKYYEQLKIAISNVDNIQRSGFFLLAIALALSGFTHLFNPIGFPTVHKDEGHFIKRSVHILEWLSPQGAKNIYAWLFDHPYFGQIFISSVLGLIGYPQTVNAAPGDLNYYPSFILFQVS